MNIFYCRETKKWFHDNDQVYTFGGSHKELIPESKTSTNQEIPFQLSLKDQHIGPLIGIMTSSRNKSLVGNWQLFIRIQNELLRANALSIVFSYEDVYDDGWLEGYVFLPSQKEWLKAKIPYPDLIYNRVPYRKDEKSERYDTCLARFHEKCIPIFNPGFIDKYQLYQILKKNQVVKHYLPDTILIESSKQLQSFIEKHKDIYIKPRELSKGQKIVRVYYHKNRFIMESQKECKMFHNIESLCHDLNYILTTKRFIAQSTIVPALIDDKRFDFRIIAHWSVYKKNYIVTGIAIRASDSYRLTTHLMNGGSIFPYKRIQSESHDSFIKMLVEEIGAALSSELGFFGEFSIDAGLSRDGNYVLYEVNSKPMSFDEKEIEQKRIVMLCELFIRILSDS
ncbi:YheC/YheD family endospore coat-associated protein [Neobacillus sp. D3-1R]|uniref:YheC/YheD family endospore coat-associated protein n=1 Tax=Neobacillus sp. D3-1R TaxID=3445778 RepID=UPI003FA12C57